MTVAGLLVPMISVVVGWGATQNDLHPDDWRMAAWGRILGCLVIPFVVFRIALGGPKGGSGKDGPGAGCLTILCLLPAWLALPAVTDLCCGPETEVVTVEEVRPHRSRTGNRGRELEHSRAAHTRIARLGDGRELRLPDRVELRPGRREIVFLPCLEVVLSAKP